MEENFLFLPAFREAVLNYAEANIEIGFALAKAIMDYGVTGEYDRSNPIINGAMSGIIERIDFSKKRYQEKKAFGEAAGRKQTVRVEDIVEFFEKGWSDAKIAEEVLGDKGKRSSVNRRRQEWKREKIAQNGTEQTAQIARNGTEQVGKIAQNNFEQVSNSAQNRTEQPFWDF